MCFWVEKLSAAEFLTADGADDADECLPTILSTDYRDGTNVPAALEGLRPSGFEPRMNTDAPMHIGGRGRDALPLSF